MSIVKSFIMKNLILIISLSILSITFGAIYYLQLFGVIGIFLLKAGLGANVAGAKTFAGAVLKAGGKKALLFTTTGVLFKRHIIDISTKFMHEHSISRYKKSIAIIFKMKMKDFKNTSGVRKIQAAVASLFTIPVFYVMWTKFVGVAIQKFVYQLFIPVLLFIWTLILQSLSFITSFISFLFQLVVINFILKFLDKSRFGKFLLNSITSTISFFGNVFNGINKGFIFFGIDPKHFIIVKSNKLNKWLENIIDKKLNARDKVRARRERHYTSREQLLLRRELYAFNKKQTKTTFIKKTKKLFRKKVLKEKNWEEKRACKKVNPILEKRKTYKQRNK